LWILAQKWLIYAVTPVSWHGCGTDLIICTFQKYFLLVQNYYYKAKLRLNQKQSIPSPINQTRGIFIGKAEKESE